MDEDDLDAELLAVTEMKKGGSSSAVAASDSEGGEFDGIVDSDGEDDDDKLDHDDDDPDDDDEFNLDDDDGDDDYGARPKKKARTSKSKSQSKSKKGSSSRARSSDKRSASRGSKDGKGGARVADHDEEPEVFEYEFDQDGYGDAADREELAKMSEIQREMLLADRKDARNREYLIWEKRREMKARRTSSAADGAGGGSSRNRSSGRSKQSSKADALKALSQDIRKKSAAPIDMDAVEADSEGEVEPKREPTSERIKEEAKPEAPVRDDDGPELRYKDLVDDARDGNGVVTTPLFLRRDTIIHLSQQPYFSRVIEGLFVRLRVGDARSSYLLCRIAGVKKVPVYDLSYDKSVRTNLHLILQSGASRKSCAIVATSGSHPTEREFFCYRERAVDGGIEIPRREEVERLRKRAYASIVEGKVSATEAEIKEHLENTETVYPRRVNWTQKRTETQTNLEIKKQELSEAQTRGNRHRVDRYEKEVRELEERLAEIRENESLYGQQSVKTNTQVFQSLAKRNMMLNSKNDTLAQGQKILNTNTATVDPFSRVETTGQSYFSIKQKGEEDGTYGENGMGDAPNVNDWRTYLLTFQSAAGRSKISDKPMEAGYGIGLTGLESFTDDAYMEPVAKKAASLVPPGLDAVYDIAARQEEELPPGAKTIAFEEWMKQRGTM